MLLPYPFYQFCFLQHFTNFLKFVIRIAEGIWTKNRPFAIAIFLRPPISISWICHRWLRPSAVGEAIYLFYIKKKKRIGVRTDPREHSSSRSFSTRLRPPSIPRGKGLFGTNYRIPGRSTARIRKIPPNFSRCP
jgi:hypothetical protein